MIERFFSGVPHPHLLGVCHQDISSTPECLSLAPSKTDTEFDCLVKTKARAGLVMVRLSGLGTALLSSASWNRMGLARLT